MRLQVCVLVPVLSIAACGGEENADEGRAPDREPPPLRVSLWGHDLHPEGPPTVISGGKVLLSGAVSGGTPGQREQLDVDLLARPDGTKRWRRVATKHPGMDQIRFGARPRRNTSYRFRIANQPEVRSNAMRIFVDLKVEVTASLPEPGFAQVAYLGRGSRPLSVGNGRVHFYRLEGGRGPLRLVGTARASSAGPGLIEAVIRYPDPEPEPSDRFYACATGQLARGFGHPDPSDPECGRRTLRADERRMRAPG